MVEVVKSVGLGYPFGPLSRPFQGPHFGSFYQGPIPNIHPYVSLGCHHVTPPWHYVMEWSDPVNHWKTLFFHWFSPFFSHFFSEKSVKKCEKVEKCLNGDRKEMSTFDFNKTCFLHLKNTVFWPKNGHFLDPFFDPFLDPLFSVPKWTCSEWTVLHAWIHRPWNSCSGPAIFCTQKTPFFSHFLVTFLGVFSRTETEMYTCVFISFQQSLKKWHVEKAMKNRVRTWSFLGPKKVTKMTYFPQSTDPVFTLF